MENYLEPYDPLMFVSAALFLALLVTRKDCPFGICAWLRRSGWKVVNCTLCSFTWFLLGLLAAYVAMAYCGYGQQTRIAITLLSAMGGGWAILALIGVANWDN